VDRNTVLWTITIFFGASILFAALRRATEGEGTAVTLGVQALALGLLIAGIVVVVRRLR
jgi:hypothetical protein